MRCLYCGNRLAILRKLADKEFCSSSHRKLYAQEQEKMALSRLVDAQKRFSREVLGVDVDSRQGFGGREEVTGFLAHPPVIRETAPIRRPEAEPMPAFTEPAVPVRSPRIAMDAQSSMKLLEAPEPKSAQPGRAPESELEPQCLLENPRPPEFLPPTCAPLLPSVKQSEISVPGACRQTPAGRQVTVEAIQGSVAPVIPDGKWSAVSSLDLAALALSLRKLSRSRAAAAARLNPSAASQPRPQAQLLPRGQPPQQTQPKQAPPQAKPQTPPPAPLSAAVSRLRPISHPGPRPSPVALRRIRPREMFFPLPRLGDLPGLAARVAKDSIRPNQYRAAIGRDKTAPRIPHSFSIEAQTRDFRSDRAEFGFQQPERRPIEWRPVLHWHGPQFPLAAKVEIARASDLAPVASPVIHESSPEFAGIEVLVPETRFAIHAHHLIGPTTQLLTDFTGALGTYSPSRQPVDPKIWKLAEGARIPSFCCRLRHARRLGESLRMSAVAPRPQHGLAVERLSVEPVEEGTGSNFQPLVPQSDPEARFAPLEVESLVRLTIPSGAAASAKSLAAPELAAIWPEPVRRLPRLFTELGEDSDVRAAVQRINLLLTEKRRWKMPSMPSMLSLASLRPDRRFAILMAPLVLLLAYYALTNRYQKQIAESRSEPVEESAGFLNGPMDNVRQSILKRAAISLSDDFRSGLGEWEGKADWSRFWSYDPSGFVRTGPLAIFTPSISLSDYTMEFLGQIEKRSIGWVFRAKDLNNYYATKITLAGNGPLPSAVIERYAVIDGKEDRRQKLVLPMQVSPDTLYRVRMDLRGSGFTLLVQGRFVDHWSDDRLKSGGIGFFSGKGEQARLRWVEVTHQYDFLGRLCAFLAPYNPAREGNLRQ